MLAGLGIYFVPFHVFFVGDDPILFDGPYYPIYDTWAKYGCLVLENGAFQSTSVDDDIVACIHF